ncbi:cobalt-precorrin-6A reductase [Clostridium thermobutyricum]|uniref:Precorrin-6A reductase n=1 Tax=Clostridium thermobutyricum DSM 4928 TaxID=1121339 RepID=A0A1V4SX24_9CLOT|nr:cobalt-precorrin-6A reductase [Clostridium thermobutyricum]OPX48207.1 precorrin-6A reductase [Clostridium thermobutyricum DSM 4928]
MLGFVLGTGEGREILREVNKFTEDIVVSTATTYGGELLKEYKVKHMNTKPLDLEGFKNFIKEWNIKVFVDASHPYAGEASKTVIKACKEENIKYIRYERESYFDKVDYKQIIRLDSYEELKEALKDIKGNILNTTGSNNALLINSLGLENRVIHRVLPSYTVIKKLTEGGITLDNIIAIKGPFGKAINDGIIKEYNIKAIITKDSGKEGGVEEKVNSAIENNAKIILINKPKVDYGTVFNNLKDLILYLKEV